MKTWKWITGDVDRSGSFLIAVSLFVILIVFLLTAAAIGIPIGLPPEGDGVDYRIPILKHMLRHHAYPNWPWTVVDDFPMLGELLMLPFYAVAPGLARLVPIFAYLGCAGFSGLIARHLSSSKSNVILWGVAAWTLGLRPLALQSNLFMTDNVASCFCLASLYFILTNRIKTAGLLCGLACATRYMIWGPSLGLVLALAFLQRKNPKILRVLFGFCLLAALGPLPNMIRNYFLNGGNPFFPVFLNLFGQGSLNYEYGYSWHGRGKDLVSFLLLPYDFLYTNTFVNGFFDYTVGKLFYIQLLAGVLFAPFFFWNRLKVNSNAWKSEGAIACLIFFVVYLLYWFFSSQQMRFFIPALVLINIGMFYVVYKLGQKTSQIGSLKFQINSMWILSALICLSILSVRSIQADSFQILRTGQTPSYEPLLTEAKECLSKIAPNSHVGFTGRGIVGFFDFETYLIPPVGYALNLPREKWPKPEYIFGGTYNLYPEYEPWPAEKPCMYKLK